MRHKLLLFALLSTFALAGCTAPTATTVSKPYASVVNAVLRMYPIEDLEDVHDTSWDRSYTVYMTLGSALEGSVQPAVTDSKCFVRHLEKFEGGPWLTEIIHTRNTTDSIVTAIKITASDATSTLISIESRGFNTLFTFVFGVEPRHSDYEQERLSEILRELGVEVEE